jgi:hypothetical protein
MMRWARTGRWTCASAGICPESSNLRHQTPGTVLAAETEVIASLLADRVTNQGKRSRTRSPSAPTSKRPSGQPAIFLPAYASTANDRQDDVAAGSPASASRESRPRGRDGRQSLADSEARGTGNRLERAWNIRG